MNATLFGKRVFADGSKLRTFETRGSSWIILVGLKSSDECPYKQQKRRHTHTERRRWLCEDGDGDCSDASASQGMPVVPEARREARDRLRSIACQGTSLTDLLTVYFSPPEPRDNTLLSYKAAGFVKLC